MRPRTRNAVIAILALLGLLLALGALPSYIKAGDPYYLTASPTAEDGPAVDVSAFPGDHYPYLTAALADAEAGAPGRSDPYWRGYVGFKEAFSHSPFDELEALRGQTTNATDGEAVFVSQDGTRYRVTIVREEGE